MSTVTDGIKDNDGDMTQQDFQTQLRSGLPLRGGGGGVWSVWIVVLTWSEGRPLRF